MKTSAGKAGALKAAQQVYLARHGETGWAISGQHTGFTDLPLTKRGEQSARQLGDVLKHFDFARVFTSPLQRAQRTCELAGFAATAEILDDLVEWDYGEYEGLRTIESRARQPGWQMFRDGFPGGESFDQIAARADRVVERVRSVDGAVLLFSSGHFLRVLAARWLGLQPQSARYFLLDTASLSSLTYEHASQPVRPADSRLRREDGEYVATLGSGGIRLLRLSSIQPRRVRGCGGPAGNHS